MARQSIIHETSEHQKKDSAVRIEVILSDGAAKKFKFGCRVLMGGAVLTITSAIWGAGAAGLVAWDHLQSKDKARQLDHARLVAGEVTRLLSANGVLSDSERSLLTEIRDRFNSLVGTQNSPEKKSIDSKLQVSLAREAAAKAKIKGHPTHNLDVREFNDESPVKVESIAHFATTQSDVLRVDLAADHRKAEAGELTVLIKYDVDGKSVIAGCCGESVATDSDVPKMKEGALFRFRRGVQKYLEVQRPGGTKVSVAGYKVGIRLNSNSDVNFSDWIPVPAKAELSLLDQSVTSAEAALHSGSEDHEDAVDGTETSEDSGTEVGSLSPDPAHVASVGGDEP